MDKFGKFIWEKFLPFVVLFAGVFLVMWICGGLVYFAGYFAEWWGLPE